MNSDPLSACRSYVSAHTTHAPDKVSRAHLCSLTLSREAGARGRSLAREMAEALNFRQGPRDVPWTVFDRDLMERVLREHDLPGTLARFFPEARWSEMDSTINSLLRRHPDAWTIFEHTVDTIRKLCQLGHAIVVGRGANFITRHLENTMHLRLIGSREQRLAHLRNIRGWSERMAKTYLESEDKNRRAFVRQHFDANIDDPGHYTVVINTDRLSNSDVVALVISWVSANEHRRRSSAKEPASLG